MINIQKVVDFLKELGRLDLVFLLKYSEFRFVMLELWYDVEVPGVEIVSPPVFTEALNCLGELDQRRICEAIAATDDSSQQKIERVVFKSQNKIDLEAHERLFPEIVIQRNSMIAVAVGEKRIEDVNDYYRARRRRIANSLKAIGLDDPNPYADLWDWYRKWKSDYHSYVERRQHVNSLYQPLIDRFVTDPPPVVPPREPTGWERVDRALDKAQLRLVESRDEEDFQAIGLLCREIIISLGQAVFDPTLHRCPDGIAPSETDGGRMIEAFLATAVAGNANEAIRKHARASLQLTNELQHKRTANFREAALCLEATSSLVNILAILSGQRDPRRES